MKKTLKILSLFFMIFALTGCMKLNVNYEVKSDKTMTMQMEMLVEESALEGSGTTADEYVEQMKQKLLSSKGMEDAKATPISKTIDESKWIGIHVEKENATVAGIMIDEKEIDGEKCIVLTLPMNSLSNQTGTDSLTNYGYSTTQMKKLGVEMNVNIKMPGDVKCNVGEIDGRTVTIDLLELVGSGKTTDIVVSSPLSNGMVMTFILIGVGLVLIIGVVFLMLKKKKQPAESSEEETRTDEESQIK